MKKYMAYLVGKPESKIGKKVQLAPSLRMSIDDALVWLGEKKQELTGKDISEEELIELQSRGELDIGQYYLCLDRDIEAIGESCR